MRKFSLVATLTLIALALVPTKAQAPGDTIPLNWNGTGPEISSDHSLLQNVTALDENGNSIQGTQIDVTALYDKPANQWSEGVTCINGSMIELSYLLVDGSVESLALPLRCAGSGTGMSGTFSGEDNSGRTVTGSITILLKVECRQECWRNAKSVSVSVSYPGAASRWQRRLNASDQTRWMLEARVIRCWHGRNNAMVGGAQVAFDTYPKGTPA